MEIAKGGRPAKVLDETEVTKLEALACCLTKSQAADYFGMTAKTLRAIEERQPEVSTAYRRGRAKAVGDIGSALYRAAMDGNIQAMKFWLKTQAGWSENKPMVEINSKPILERVINIFTHYNHTEFYIALGYKSEIIKEYFNSNENSKINYEVLGKKVELNLIDTGLDTMTGGRIKKMQQFINNETFMVTYGDGVSNVDLAKLEEFHTSHKKLISVTAVRPPARFGAIKINGKTVRSFKEKSKLDEGWINGGFFVMEPKFLDYIKSDKTFLEREPLEKACKKRQLSDIKHNGFWYCMDTKRDKDNLEEIFKKGKFKI